MPTSNEIISAQFQFVDTHARYECHGTSLDYEDVRQETLLRAWRCLDGVNFGDQNADAHQRGYLRTTCRSVQIDAFRKISRRPQVSRREDAAATIDFDVETPADAVERQVGARRALQRLQSLLEVLDPASKALYRAFFVEGLNATEVAAKLGVTAGCARMRKKELLDRLRAQLQPEATLC